MSQNPKKSPSRYWQTDHEREFLVYSSRQRTEAEKFTQPRSGEQEHLSGLPRGEIQQTLTVNLWQSLPFPTGTACWANPMWNRHWRLGRRRKKNFFFSFRVLMTYQTVFCYGYYEVIWMFMWLNNSQHRVNLTSWNVWVLLKYIYIFNIIRSLF